MSDDNSRDRPASSLGTRGAGGGGSSKATQAGPVPGKSVKRGPAARTMLGLPVMDPGQAQRIARAGISGRPPVGAPVQSSLPPPPEKDLGDSDTRYMEPPSEALGRAQTEVVPPSQQPFARPAVAGPAQPLASEPGAGLFGSTVQRAHSPSARTPEPVFHPPAGAGLFSTSLSAMHDPEAPKPGAPRTNFATNQAPEAWRDDVRRVAERAQPPRPKVQPGPTASLRLKLDADAYEEQPYRAPKSALPSVLLWLVVLGLVGGAAAYYVQGHGGVNAVVDRLRGVAPAPARSAPAAQDQAPSALQPTAAEQPGQQPAAAAANPAGQLPAARNQPTEPPAQPPSAATAQGLQGSPPTAAPASADDSARLLADPEPPQAQPPAAAAHAPAAAPASPSPVKKAESKPKAAAPRAAPTRRHEPVVKVRPLDGTSSAPSSVDIPPAPSDMPYVPVPADPPSPDEPR